MLDGPGARSVAAFGGLGELVEPRGHFERPVLGSALSRGGFYNGGKHLGVEGTHGAEDARLGRIAAAMRARAFPDDLSVLLAQISVFSFVVVAISGAGPMTATALRERLPDIPPATLYRHLKVLNQAGVLRVVDERRVRGAVERTYSVDPDRARLRPVDVGTASRDELLAGFTTFVGTLLADMGSYVSAEGIDATRDGLAFLSTPIHMSDEEFAAFGQDFQALLVRAMSMPATPERRPRTLATVVIPGTPSTGELS